MLESYFTINFNTIYKFFSIGFYSNLFKLLSKYNFIYSNYYLNLIIASLGQNTRRLSVKSRIFFSDVASTRED